MELCMVVIAVVVIVVIPYQKYYDTANFGVSILNNFWY